MKEQKKKKKKKRLIILAVIVVVVIAIAALSSSGDDENKVESIDGSDSSVSSSVDDSSSNDASDEETTQGVQKIKSGTAISTDDFKISYISCDTNYTNYNQYSAPSSGNKVVRVKFTLENISSVDQYPSSFECYADNQKCETFYGADDYSNPVLESVSPGRSIDAVLYFEVPENSKEIELEYESDYWKNEKIIFVVE